MISKYIDMGFLKELPQPGDEFKPVGQNEIFICSSVNVELSEDSESASVYTQVFTACGKVFPGGPCYKRLKKGIVI